MIYLNNRFRLEVPDVGVYIRIKLTFLFFFFFLGYSASCEGFTPAVDLSADLPGSTSMHNVSVPPSVAENTAVSISRPDCPAEADGPGGEENNTRLPTASSTDLPAHEEPQSPLVSSTKSWKERKRVRWSSTDAGGREGEEAEVDVDRIAPAEAEDGDLEKTVGLDPPARLQGAFQKELDGKNQELPEQEVARHQLLDGTSLISAVCVCVCVMNTRC